ncbi:helix-turn-helix domain-containing protein [Alteraurantiacibacter aquimixticola]|uniref:Helix-turn-helix domain-containing protein n=1 Tax=Alteraurantiacibacter aquimixticola TaxID=2489173 RepID=A0A4T3F2Z2_9SPHN|nr:helix-turn-helix domain-containing protein [Alteraurantiacibacter aquimixticola]TIX50675.1 helix-turn-helix domain-containing protein [Alteraurantiacibacter aquimixticola]
MATQLPPSFFLYGEAEQVANPDFVHIEDLAARSRPSGWSISPHKHADLNHLILISSGGGVIQYESDFSEFIAPALLVVPAGAIHGFEWHTESGGQVLTIADVQLQQLCSEHGEFAKLFETSRCIALEPGECEAIDDSMTLIARELSWKGLGQSAALQAGLLMVMVQAARRLQHVEGEIQGTTRQRDIVARFRQLLEKRYRQREPVDTYARELGVSQTALREACAAMGQPPIAMRDQRAILESQRLLAFSAMSIAEIGEAVGIGDPAYFSRFFTRKCGSSPAQWRRDAMRGRTSGR